MDEKSMQWVWRPFNDSLGDRVSIFTHTMHDHYNAPRGFNVDVRNPVDKRVIDDERLETFNADEKSAEIYDYVMDMATHY